MTATPCIRHSPRALDWFCAAMIFAWGLILLLPGATLSSSQEYLVLLRRFTEEQWAAILIAIGLLRFVALVINGRWPPGSPVLRGLAALMGAVVWSQFGWAFLAISVRTGVPAASVGVSLVMLGGDLFSAVRAASDAMRARLARNAQSI